MALLARKFVLKDIQHCIDFVYRSPLFMRVVSDWVICSIFFALRHWSLVSASEIDLFFLNLEDFQMDKNSPPLNICHTPTREVPSNKKCHYFPCIIIVNLMNITKTTSNSSPSPSTEKKTIDHVNLDLKWLQNLIHDRIKRFF